MSVAEAVAAVMFTAVILYAVFGGADFGSGVWDLTAGDRQRGAPVRRLIDHAIGPVWEANHVWLVFVLVFLWTGFPTAFASLMRSLAIPFWLAGLGIVARGAGFAFRKYSPTLRWARLAGIVFASASLATPFFFGTIAGSIASGRVPAEGTTELWSPWLNPTSLFGGVLAVATCTFLAGVLLTAEAHKLNETAVAESLKGKAFFGGLMTGAIALAGIPILIIDDRALVDGLLGRGLPLVVISAAAGVMTLWLLWNDRYSQARISAAIAVATVVAGWGAAQYPWILLDELKISEAAGAKASLVGLLVAAGIAAVLVLPPLAYLLSLSNANKVGDAPTGPSSDNAGTRSDNAGTRSDSAVRQR